MSDIDPFSPDAVPGKREQVEGEREESSAKRQRRPASVFSARLDVPVSKPVFRACFDAAKTKIGPRFVPYSMDGAQAATTAIKGFADGQEKTFRTATQKHSEMCAIEHLSNNNFVVFKEVGNVIQAAMPGSGSGITLENFTTVEPHCGYCTIILALLGLPLTLPTQGKFNQASNLAYPLPAKLKEPNMIFTMLFCGDNQKFQTFIAETFLQPGNPVVIDVVADQIQIGRDDRAKLSVFLAAKPAGLSYSRGDYIWKCFFAFLNDNLQPLT